jgi:hypothetical protein
MTRYFTFPHAFACMSGVHLNLASFNSAASRRDCLPSPPCA